MKRVAMIGAQIAIVALAISVLAVLLYEPTIEGVNADATSLHEIYFDDPFLAYIYVAFMFVFVGLYQAFRLIGYMRQGGVISDILRALTTIRNCALIFASLIFAAVAYVALVVSGSDDTAGGVAMGCILIVASSMVAVFAGRWKRRIMRSA